MNPYEELNVLLQPKKETSRIRKGKMLHDHTCLLGELTLEREDLLLMQHVSVEPGDSVILYKMPEEQYLILGKLV